jgi:hypothetical protein
MGVQKQRGPKICFAKPSIPSTHPNDITVLVSGEQKHYFHLWGLQKAKTTRDFFRPYL